MTDLETLGWHVDDLTTADEPVGECADGLSASVAAGTATQPQRMVFHTDDSLGSVATAYMAFEADPRVPARR